MNARDWKRGYLKTCAYCGETIYMGYSGTRWLPFESWQAGNAAEGAFAIHDCRRALERSHLRLIK